MTEKQEAALRLALDALDEFCELGAIIRPLEVRDALREALAEQPAQQEPVAFPPVQFEKVAEGVEVGYDMLGGVDIRLGGEFVYVHINYDYRYTHNAARKALADQIVGLLTSQQPSKPWVGLTEGEIDVLYEAHHNQYGECETPGFGYERAIEAKLREKNA